MSNTVTIDLNKATNGHFVIVSYDLSGLNVDSIEYRSIEEIKEELKHIKQKWEKQGIKFTLHQLVQYDIEKRCEYTSTDFDDVDADVANDGEQFVVYYHQKTGHLPKIIASGFQFKQDAEYWSEQYRKNNPECGKLFIAKLPNENVKNLLTPTDEQLEEFEAEYSAYAD